MSESSAVDVTKSAYQEGQVGELLHARDTEHDDDDDVVKCESVKSKCRSQTVQCSDEGKNEK